MREDEKPIRWMGSSLKDIREFPEPARRDAGFELSRVQFGEEPSDFKYVGTRPSRLPENLAGNGAKRH
jgi:phage-related protein